MTNPKVSRAPDPIKPISGGSYSRSNSNSRIPDWDIWLNSPFLTLRECVALSLNIDPSKTKFHSMGGINEGDTFNARLMLVERHTGKDLSLKPISSSIYNVKWNTKVDPVNFVKWVCSLTKPWDMPNELLDLKNTTESQIKSQTSSKRILLSTKQSELILFTLNALGYDSQKLPVGKGKTKGAKGYVWDSISKSEHFKNRVAFNTIWQNMLNTKEISNVS